MYDIAKTKHLLDLQLRVRQIALPQSALTPIVIGDTEFGGVARVRFATLPLRAALATSLMNAVISD